MNIRIVLVVVALGVGACGDGDSLDATDTSALVTTVATTAATTDTSAAVSTTSTSGAVTTSTEVRDPLLEAALAAAGTYSGSWTNTTFGSTGDAGFTLTVDDTGALSMQWDLGGFVFGDSDPDGERHELVVSDLTNGVTVATALLGDVDIAIDSSFSAITMDAEDVPTSGIEAFRAMATLDGSTVTGTYVVEFEGSGPPAEGEFELVRN